LCASHCPWGKRREATDADDPVNIHGDRTAGLLRNVGDRVYEEAVEYRQKSGLS
jgi:hypothetical protein